MDVRDAVLQRVNQRTMRMRTALERFNDDSAEREKVGPTWNVRDLAGHMAHWTAVAAERIAAMGRGTAPPAGLNIEQINAEVYRKNRRMSYVMLLPQLRAAEERLMAVLRALESTKLMGETPIRMYLKDAVLDHYDHHWPGLEAAAGRLGE